MDVQDQIFDFETDFAGTLRCIPMCIRYRLDEIGIKLSLKQWNVFTTAQRRQLVALAHDEPQLKPEFTAYLLDLMRPHSGGEPERVPAVDIAEWRDGAQIPPRLVSYATALGVEPPSPTSWAALSPLQRFALYKLTRPGHDNDNFIPAMREFGLLQ